MAAWVRSETPSLKRIWRMRFLTVLMLIERSRESSHPLPNQDVVVYDDDPRWAGHPLKAHLVRAVAQQGVER